MQKATTLSALLADLNFAARRRSLNDSAWCRAAGVRKETLSRLRKRTNCDLGTLVSLAAAAGAHLGVRLGADMELTADGHFPVGVGREYEDRLVNLALAGNYEPRNWLAAGPAFFMAGLAVMVSTLTPHLDRRRLLQLAESMHPGSSQPEVMTLWLERSPVRPSRFAPLLRQRSAHAA